jgi:uncharacterized protein (DUF1800 family)
MGINENLARELMELHTLGVDAGYEQSDVRELARIITGAGVWASNMQARNLQRAGAVRRGLFLFDPRRHDFGAKRLLGQPFPAGSGLPEIDRALHMLATHPSTARHISRKLALRFLSDAPSEKTVEQMTDAFRRSGGRISVTLFAMVETDEFKQSLEGRIKFKEPLDQLLSDVRASCQSQAILNGELLAASANDAGQAPFMRSTPDGYGAREADWLSPAAMAMRVRFAMGLAAGRIKPASVGGPANADTNAAMAGTCRSEAGSVAATLAPLSTSTLAAINKLEERERIGALLSSPEALRR